MGNGQIPSSMLGPVPGSNAGLLKPAALAYTAMHYHSLKVTGVPLTIIDGQVGRTYRSFARQVLAKSIYGSNAATPGYSNHGLAKAVDLMTSAQRAAIDRIGAFFGWAKRCSDASWEWWHMLWNPSCTGASFKPTPRRPDPLRKLTKRQHRFAAQLLYHRRERRQEARSGKGPRYRKHDRWVNYWYERVENLWRRAENDERKRVLRRVLDDRNGRI